MPSWLTVLVASPGASITLSSALQLSAQRPETEQMPKTKKNRRCVTYCTIVFLTVISDGTLSQRESRLDWSSEVARNAGSSPRPTKFESNLEFANLAHQTGCEPWPCWLTATRPR